MDAALGMGKSLQGHLPDMVGPALNVCMAAGVSTDHESLGAEDAVARLRSGCHLMMRRAPPPQPGGVHQAYPGKPHGHLPCLHRHRRPAHLRRGGPRPLDEAVRTALKCGADFVTAIQMVTLNAARAFNLDMEIGGLAPGRGRTST